MNLIYLKFDSKMLLYTSARLLPDGENGLNYVSDGIDES